MDDPVEYFKAFTSSSSEVARRYLGLTDNNAEQAIQLFFDSPELASGLDQGPPSLAQPVVPSGRPEAHATSAEPNGAANVDLDDDEAMEIGEDEENPNASHTNALRAAGYEDDEAVARRLQEELYAGGDASSGFDADGVRAPIGRRTETLVGGPGAEDWEGDDMHAAVLQQMRARQHARQARPGVFNQAPVASSSIWEESTDSATRRQVLSQATGGASEASSKAARLAELFRPPFELMRQVPWDMAREQGKDEQKWLLVNVQDTSIFDCQQLNRDIWKDQGVKEIVKESFVFLQYSKDDPRGAQYCQYYFQTKDSDAAYPHIAIVDPRTGEQVKVWSGPPVPRVSDFLMQLYEFLDRYSLDTKKKNPVAKRKLEKPKEHEVDKLTEDEMLDLALQNSLATNGAPGPKETDPDDLTKSFTNAGESKGKEVEAEIQPGQTSSLPSTSPFSTITSDLPHEEPPQGPGITRVQFKHATGRVVRRFNVDDKVRRIYEWLKAEPLDGKVGVEFDLKAMGKDLIDHLEDTIEEAGLKQSTVMVEFLED